MIPTTPVAHGPTFLRRVQIATYGAILLVLAIYLLEKFERILQPLFVALFLGFLTNPIHRWMARRGIPSLVAYGVLVSLVVLGIFGFMSLLYANFTEVADKGTKLVVPDMDKMKPKN